MLEASSKLGKETFSFDPANNILDSYHSHKVQSHLQSEQEKDYGYNRLLDQQYQYDAYGLLLKKYSKKPLYVDSQQMMQEKLYVTIKFFTNSHKIWDSFISH